MRIQGNEAGRVTGLRRVLSPHGNIVLPMYLVLHDVSDSVVNIFGRQFYR